MLFLVTSIGGDRYALNTAQIEDILPMVQLKAVPQAPQCVAGAFNYRGSPVPVVDLTALLTSQTAARRFSTRLVVVSVKRADGTPQRLGLIAEHATETVRINPMDFAPSAVAGGRAPYLGPIANDSRGLVQWIDPAQILPAVESPRPHLGDEPA